MLIRMLLTGVSFFFYITLPVPHLFRETVKLQEKDREVSNNYS